MVLGGGATSTSGSSTPVAGGVSGSSGELTNFAPLDSSNLVYMGDLKQGASTTLSQKLIVNTSTQPGVYTLKISFVYTNSKGNQVVDDQVITLLVYSLPQVQIDFYRDPGMYGQMTAGSWIYIGTQGILQGTYETLGSLARQKGWPSLRGKFVLTAGLGGMMRSRTASTICIWREPRPKSP